MAKALTFPPVDFNVHSTPTYRRTHIPWTSASNPPPYDESPLLGELDTPTESLPGRGPAHGGTLAVAAAMANHLGFEPVVFNPSTPTNPMIASTPTAANFDDEEEPPLLEELDIDTRLIWRKTLSILHPLRSADPALHADADLSGPLLILLSLALFQLLAGKFHFGIVLGWATAASVFLYLVASMVLSERGRGNLGLYTCASLLGYCMLSMTIFSAVSLFLPQGGGLIFTVGMGFVMWSTRVCTTLLLASTGHGDEHRGLIAYPCCLVFMLFSLLVIF